MSARGAVLGALALACVALRVAAARGDLWLDEIWTFLQVAPLSSPLELLTRLREDNHLLYTLWIYALDGRHSELLARLPSLLAGIAMLPLAAALARTQAEHTGAPERARAAGTFAWLLVGFSHLEIHYASEARGYALCVALALAAARALLRGSERPGWRGPAAYGAASCLALLAHPIAVHALAAGLAWSALRLWRRRAGAAEAARSLLAWHGAPLLFLALFYSLYLSRLATLGGPLRAPLDVAGRLAVFSFGLPEALPDLAALAVAAAALIAAGVALARSPGDLWIFYAVGVVISPLALSALRGEPLYFERYYLLSATLALLLCADGLSRLWRRSSVAAVLLWLFVLGNALHTAELVRYGRGDTRGLLALLAHESEGARITYAADHEFRLGTMLDFYAPAFLTDHQLVIEPADAAPEWLLFHGTGAEPGPAQLQVGPRLYRHRATFPAAPLSGWHVFVYRRADAAQ